jgi:hypothetical protein
MQQLTGRIHFNLKTHHCLSRLKAIAVDPDRLFKFCPVKAG